MDVQLLAMEPIFIMSDQDELTLLSHTLTRVFQFPIRMCCICNDRIMVAMPKEVLSQKKGFLCLEPSCEGEREEGRREGRSKLTVDKESLSLI